MAQKGAYHMRQTEMRYRADEGPHPLVVLLGLLFILLAFGLAGSMDYQDRVAGLGADMMPTASRE